MRPNTVVRFIPLGIALTTGLAVCAAAGAAAESAAAVPAPSQKAEITPGLAPVFASPVLLWGADILRWSEGYGLDPNLVATVMQIESCGNPRAVSRSGAQGLFQVMPYHFAAGEDMQDPEVNARRGLAYLAEALLRAEGDVERALAGYNGGHGMIARNPSEWPLETQRYAFWGAGIYADAAAGLTSSPRLEEWLAAGGFSLCGKYAGFIS
jgi:soluble lytic murein transglycosylase-like protein